jgi:hypothetical protein
VPSGCSASADRYLDVFQFLKVKARGHACVINVFLLSMSPSKDKSIQICEDNPDTYSGNERKSINVK